MSGVTSTPDRRAVVVAVIVIVVLLVVYGTALVRGGESARVGASIEEILSQPEEVVGERWAVSGQVQDVAAEGLVIIGGPEFGTDPLPVLLTSRAREVNSTSIQAGDVGQFTGRFRPFEVDEVERQLRDDVPEERLAPFEDGLLLVADRAAVDERLEKRPGCHPHRTSFGGELCDN